MSASRARLGLFLVAGLIATAGIAFAVSPFASSEPDGLERVAIDQGFDSSAEEHTLADGPTADYALSGVEDDRLATGLAGVIGVVATFGLGAGTVWVLRRLRRPQVALGSEVDAGTT